MARCEEMTRQDAEKKRGWQGCQAVEAYLAKQRHEARFGEREGVDVGVVCKCRERHRTRAGVRLRRGRQLQDQGPDGAPRSQFVAKRLICSL